MDQSDLLATADGESLTPAHVQRRVDDWLARLDALMTDIRRWAADHGWQAEDAAPIPMHEEPMQRAGVPEHQQPALHLRDPSGREVWVQPKALWVIGANGRVDIFSPLGIYRLIDRADPFAAPEWVLYQLGNRQGRRFEPSDLAATV